MTKWTKELITEEASKHTKRGLFQKASPAAYAAARNGKFLDEVCAHMVGDGRAGNKRIRKPKVEVVAK